MGYHTCTHAPSPVVVIEADTQLAVQHVRGHSIPQIKDKQFRRKYRKQVNGHSVTQIMYKQCCKKFRTVGGECPTCRSNCPCLGGGGQDNIRGG